MVIYSPSSLPNSPKFISLILQLTNPKKVNEIAMRKPIIPRTVLLFWLCYYMMKNYKKFSKYSLKMFDGMLQENEKNSYKKMLNATINSYRNNPPHNQYSELIKSL